MKGFKVGVYPTRRFSIISPKALHVLVQRTGEPLVSHLYTPWPPPLSFTQQGTSQKSLLGCRWSGGSNELNPLDPVPPLPSAPHHSHPTTPPLLLPSFGCCDVTSPSPLNSPPPVARLCVQQFLSGLFTGDFMTASGADGVSECGRVGLVQPGQELA